ncbi:hypothetical protein FA09DRAFT_12835 [Tilletiopsis washingtonensis]|uniref:Uncharacterized protein n=1 Tax=Tilletiopsis washingtonensis TaxID=58919 RepID=A0A316ZLW4_9BASI|nr:hypothetical protein FA09DRAFT_12835 [Tilletiopsis washingtonensis]PWO01386.1 hypothetical protein FA09DRAFT_12835 [Tilletiopsis washingtonensis]
MALDTCCERRLRIREVSLLRRRRRHGSSRLSKRAREHFTRQRSSGRHTEPLSPLAPWPVPAAARAAVPKSKRPVAAHRSSIEAPLSAMPAAVLFSWRSRGTALLHICALRAL